ncbi:hypothetical protein DCAR_0309849 [Daucus carota subsp. sativus]|uniref:Uncharacterized protein n=1 Tax=Daucus carota subsp. sativus TaxID=79200 RepID=A0A165ZFE0_DAUCS|nr:hypothetical protein DCAR_0309849 [Daucus carota subsp. sativus]
MSMFMPRTGTTDEFCTPSPRRLRDVDLSGIHKRTAFRTINLSQRHSIESTSNRTLQSGVTQCGQDDDVNIIVPEPGQLGWFQSDSQRGGRNLLSAFNSTCMRQNDTASTRVAWPVNGDKSSVPVDGGTSGVFDEHEDGVAAHEADQEEVLNKSLRSDYEVKCRILCSSNRKLAAA